MMYIKIKRSTCGLVVNNPENFTHAVSDTEDFNCYLIFLNASHYVLYDRVILS